MRRVMPSMFSRRLLMLAVGAFAVVLVLLTQLAKLTVAEAALWRQKAEAVLVRQRLIPTARGQILDRRMRVLAVDKPQYQEAQGVFSAMERLFPSTMPLGHQKRISRTQKN